MHTLGLEALAHRAAAVLRAGPLGRFTLAPGERLGVQILEIGEASRGEEAFPNKADGALDAPLLVPAGDRHRPRCEPIPGGELEQCRVEADRIGGTLEVYPLEHRGA